MIMPLCGQKIDSMFCSNSIIISLAFDFLASLRAMRKRLRSRLVDDEPEEMPENEGETVSCWRNRKSQNQFSKWKKKIRFERLVVEVSDSTENNLYEEASLLKFTSRETKKKEKQPLLLSLRSKQVNLGVDDQDHSCFLSTPATTGLPNQDDQQLGPTLCLERWNTNRLI